MINKEDIQLFNNLRFEIKKSMSFISNKEKILGQTEGEVTILIPSFLSEKPMYCVKINSYLMNSSGFKTEWVGNTLKSALQKAITGVKFWYQFEEDVGTLTPLSKGLIQDYL